MVFARGGAKTTITNTLNTANAPHLHVASIHPCIQYLTGQLHSYCTAIQQTGFICIDRQNDSVPASARLERQSAKLTVAERAVGMQNPVCKSSNNQGIDRGGGEGRHLCFHYCDHYWEHYYGHYCDHCCDHCCDHYCDHCCAQNVAEREESHAIGILETNDSSLPKVKQDKKDRQQNAREPNVGYNTSHSFHMDNPDSNTRPRQLRSVCVKPPLVPSSPT